MSSAGQEPKIMSTAPYAAYYKDLDVPEEAFTWFDYDKLSLALNVKVSGVNHPHVRFQDLLSVGDPIADAIYTEATTCPGSDATASLAEGVCPITGGGAWPSPAQILDNVLLKQGTAMDVTEAEQRFLDQVYTVPEWVDWELIERGRAVFWKNMGGIQVVLLYASLAGGFSIPRVNDVLVQTGYLTSAKHLQRRLLETGQMINDVMQAGLRPGSDGWMSVLRVRLLHCAVRRRQHRATGQIVPINQTDLIGTLLGFQCSTIMGLAKMWTFLSPAERDAYTHLWRYVGLLIGVDPAHDPLQHGFDVTCTGLKDYLQLYFIPDEISIKLANTLLDTVSSTAATRSRPSRALNVSLTRHFLSDSLAAALDLPKQNIWYRFLALMALGLVYVLGQLAYLPFVGPRMIGERKRRMARIMDGISKHTAGSIHQPSLTSPVDAPHMKSA